MKHGVGLAGLAAPAQRSCRRVGGVQFFVRERQPSACSRRVAHWRVRGVHIFVRERQPSRVPGASRSWHVGGVRIFVACRDAGVWEDSHSRPQTTTLSYPWALARGRWSNFRPRTTTFTSPQACRDAGAWEAFAHSSANQGFLNLVIDEPQRVTGGRKSRS